MERFFKKEYDCHFYLSKRGIPIGMPTLFAQYTHKTLQAIERVTTQSSLTGDIKHQLVTKEIGEQTAYQVCNRLGLFLDYINDYNGNPFVSLDVHTALPDEVINEYLNEYLVGERGKSLDAVEKHKTALEAYYNWGIGGKLTKRLQQLGIDTALQLADADPKYIRQHFTVVVERTLRELNGESCIALEEMAPTKKQIVSSRAFGERITDKQQMREAISEYISRACKKLRQEQQEAKYLTVFLRTSPFSDKDAPYSASKSVGLDSPTGDTRIFLAKAMQLLDGLWLDGYRYAKAGVMLSDFYDPGVHQPGLFDEPLVKKESDQNLMHLIDTLNAKHGKTIWFASQGTKQDWSMKRELLSPAYTTNWTQLPVAK